MSKRKVVYIISDIDKALSFEWIARHLPAEHIQLSFILINPGPSQLETFLKQHGFLVITVRCAHKLHWPAAILQVWQYLRQVKPDFVHCHLLQANIIGLTAAYLAGVPHRVYTRHHSSLHHQYHPKGIFWDKLANGLATRIIAISGVVKTILVEWEGVDPGKVLYIPHGFDLSIFEDATPERVAQFRERIRCQTHTPVVGVISRFTEWKGIQYIIPAFASLLQEYPDALLLLLNAKGDFEQQIITQLSGSLPAHSYRIIPFEQDIAAAYKAMDMFIHVPVNHHCEAFGQIYIEALAAGVPAIFTRSGIANDPEFEMAAIMVNYQSSSEILKQMLELLHAPGRAVTKQQYGLLLAQKFSLKLFIQQLESLYLR